MIKQKPKVNISLLPGIKIKVIDSDKRKSQNESRKFVATVLKEYKDYWLVRNENGYNECLSKRLIEIGYIKIQTEALKKMITVAELLSEKQKLQELEKQYKTQKQIRKSYISESDRQEFILLAAIGGKLEDLLKNYMQYKKPKPRVTALKYAITYIFKALEDYFVGMSEQEKQKEVQKILRDLKSGRYEVMLVKKY